MAKGKNREPKDAQIVLAIPKQAEEKNRFESKNAKLIVDPPKRKYGWLVWLLILGAIITWIVLPKPQANQQAGIVGEKVCHEAWQQEQDHVNNHRTEKGIPYFDIVLTGDDCFGADVWRPDDWHTWEKEFLSDEPDAHVSFWFHGFPPQGPYPRNALPHFNNPPSPQFRLKGKGTLRYFRTS